MLRPSVPVLALISVVAVSASVLSAAQTPPAAPAARPAPPTRDPNTPGYVTSKELPDGGDRAVKQQTLPAALEWLWRD